MHHFVLQPLRSWQSRQLETGQSLFKYRPSLYIDRSRSLADSLAGLVVALLEQLVQPVSETKLAIVRIIWPLTAKACLEVV